MDDLRRTWRGDYGLGAAFWLFYLLGGIAIMIVGSLVLVAARFAGIPTTGVVLVTGVAVSYFILVAVGVWRAASRHYGSFAWAIVAKAVILLHAASLACHFANGGAIAEIKEAKASIHWWPDCNANE
jgi:hypothetical protein